MGGKEKLAFKDDKGIVRGLDETIVGLHRGVVHRVLHLTALCRVRKRKAVLLQRLREKERAKSRSKEL